MLPESGRSIASSDNVALRKRDYWCCLVLSGPLQRSSLLDPGDMCPGLNTVFVMVISQTDLSFHQKSTREL